MREPQPKTIHLKDYTPPAFRVETVELDVDIKDDHAIVRAKLAIKRLAPGQLVLDGDEVELISAAGTGRSSTIPFRSPRTSSRWWRRSSSTSPRPCAPLRERQSSSMSTSSPASSTRPAGRWIA